MTDAVLTYINNTVLLYGSKTLLLYGSNAVLMYGSNMVLLSQRGQCSLKRAAISHKVIKSASQTQLINLIVNF
jgi:hypothetical protein